MNGDYVKRRGKGFKLAMTVKSRTFWDSVGSICISYIVFPRQSLKDEVLIVSFRSFKYKIDDGSSIRCFRRR